MRSLLSLTRVGQDGGHGKWHGSDVIGACALYLRLPTWDKMAAMAIDIGVTSSAHALYTCADPCGTRWRPWQLTWEWRHRRMRSLLALTHMGQDGGHGKWHGSDVIGACALHLRLPTWDKMAAMAIDVRVTSSAHALSNCAYPRGTRWRPWQLTWEWRHRRMRSNGAFPRGTRWRPWQWPGGWRQKTAATHAHWRDSPAAVWPSAAPALVDHSLKM